MTSQDIESMRKDMEEEILSQIQANQQVLQDSKTSWDLKVGRQSDADQAERLERVEIRYYNSIANTKMSISRRGLIIFNYILNRKCL